MDEEGKGLIEIVKPVELLTAADLAACPVWSYANRDGAGETFVRSVHNLPVTNLTGKIIGTRVRFAKGTFCWALIGNIDPENSRFNAHFMTFSIERAGKWFHLARYHDLDYGARGPDALSQFLELEIDEIFPIMYDVRQFVQGGSELLSGTILKEPLERLSRAEIIIMAVP